MTIATCAYEIARLVSCISRRVHHLEPNAAGIVARLSHPACLTLRLPEKEVRMKRIGLALLAGVLPALSAAPHAATLGVSMALFDDNFLTAVRASMKERAQQLSVPIQFEDAQNDIGRQLNQIQNFIARSEERRVGKEC